MVSRCLGLCIDRRSRRLCIWGAIGESPTKLAIEGGKSFWILVPFTMQMAMIIIGGYVVASSPGVYWVIRKVAGITTNPGRPLRGSLSSP